jgi:hypothetical protein
MSALSLASALTLGAFLFDDFADFFDCASVTEKVLVIIASTKSIFFIVT